MTSFVLEPSTTFFIYYDCVTVVTVISVMLSYASPLVRKLHLCSGVTSKSYKPAFHGSYLSHNTSHGSTTTIQVFRLPWWRYSYLTQSFMMELLLSVS